MAKRYKVAHPPQSSRSHWRVREEGYPEEVLPPKRPRHKSRRVQIRDILSDPEERRELMIRTIIATQAREGITVTRERAEEVYDKIQDELGRQENPGEAPIERNDARSMVAAEKTFRRFHSRKGLEPVFPFHKQEHAIFELEGVDWPEQVSLLGVAMRTLYESDKWHQRGETVEYYHDHDRNIVKFMVPSDEDSSLEPVQLPYGWPDEVMLIGECIGFVTRPLETGEITEGTMKGKNVLVASPDGWVDPRKPNRVFLAIINLDGGGVEAIIDGPKLRITAHGIEG